MGLVMMSSMAMWQAPLQGVGAVEGGPSVTCTQAVAVTATAFSHHIQHSEAPTCPMSSPCCKRKRKCNLQPYPQPAPHLSSVISMMWSLPWVLFQKGYLLRM